MHIYSHYLTKRSWTRASAENFSGGGQRKKRPKISKKYQK